MVTDMHQFISSCTVCAQSKVTWTLPIQKLMPLPTPQHPWSHLALDFMADLPACQGKTVILVIIDLFSKSLCLIPLSKILTTVETAELMFNWVFWYFGLLEDIVSDWGSQFTSQVWKHFMDKLEVTVSLTSGYHPQAKGQVEWADHEISIFFWDLFVSTVRRIGFASFCGLSMHMYESFGHLTHPFPVHHWLPTSLTPVGGQPFWFIISRWIF